MKNITGENGKSISVDLKEGVIYLWISTENDSGWSIFVSAKVFKGGIRAGCFSGQSETGADRRITVTLSDAEAKVRIHHPTSKSGLSITVSTQALANAIEGA